MPLWLMGQDLGWCVSFVELDNSETKPEGLDGLLDILSFHVHFGNVDFTFPQHVNIYNVHILMYTNAEKSKV